LNEFQERKMNSRKSNYLAAAHQVLEGEIKSLQNLNVIIDVRFEKACEMVAACKGRVIFTGVGHSGHVGRKSAANMSSMHKPAFFLHAGEAAHGELGLVTGADVVILISNSGETAEVLSILPQIKQLGAGTIAITGKVESTLAKECEVVLPIGAEEEAGLFKFAGSSSALNSMALCDALVMAVSSEMGLNEAEYLKSHPGGTVGEQLKAKLE
jgi:arabinose-5-phosphate isomerase